MKITGYKIRKYTYNMDRALGDANLPGGSGTWMAGSFAGRSGFSQSL